MFNINKKTRLLLFATLLTVHGASLAAEDEITRGDVIAINEDAPESYVVVEGDTLWDIAGVFLEQPWQWPRIWQVNPQIENPDLIYPGDVISLVYEGGQPRLVLERADQADPDLPVVRRSPEIRRQPLRSPVPAIALEDISSFLSDNRLLSREELDAAPTVLGSRTGRRFSRPGDLVFAAGQWQEGVNSYDIVRPTREIEDPESGDMIAVESTLVGTATVETRDGRQASLLIADSNEEVRVGDYLVPGEQNTLEARYFPVPPPFDVNARVLDIDFGRSIGGRLDTLVVNIGAADGLETGHLLSLQKAAQTVEGEGIFGSSLGAEEYTFAGEIYGRVLVYKVFEDHSFVLVLSASLPVAVDDRVITP